MTAGLALAETVRECSSPITWDYFGYDIAEAMLNRANQFSQTSFSSNIKCQFSSKLEVLFEQLETNQNKTMVALINASYLFASSSLNEVELAQAIARIIKILNCTCYFVFQNPVNVLRNEKYRRFKDNISHKEVFSMNNTVSYFTSAKAFEPRSEYVAFELLQLHL